MTSALFDSPFFSSSLLFRHNTKRNIICQFIPIPAEFANLDSFFRLSDSELQNNHKNPYIHQPFNYHVKSLFSFSFRVSLVFSTSYFTFNLAWTWLIFSTARLCRKTLRPINYIAFVHKYINRFIKSEGTAGCWNQNHLICITLSFIYFFFLLFNW
jgi:hypothetical protein